MEVNKTVFQTLTGAALLASAVQLQAANYTVTTTTMTGPGSLYQAIANANGSPGADTIDFDPSLSGQTIQLNRPQASGPEILPVISDDLTINGPGSQNLTLDGGIQWVTANGHVNAGYPPPAVKSAGVPGYIYMFTGHRIFVIDDGDPATTIDVTITGLKLTNAHAPHNDRSGGAVLNSENLTLERMFFNRNYAEQGGAAVLSSRGALVIRDSSLDNNGYDLSSFHLGSVHLEGGSLLLDHSHISRGVGSGVTAMSINGTRPTVEIRDSTITQHRDGSAVRVFESALKIVNSSITHNEARPTGGFTNMAPGAGVGAHFSDVEIVNSTLLENHIQGSVSGSGIPQGQPFGGEQLYVAGGSLKLVNSVLSHWQNMPAFNPDVFLDSRALPAVVANSNNFVGDGSLEGASSGDPMLPFFPNATPAIGNTPYFPPLPGSPLIDAGSNTVAVDPISGYPLTIDQPGLIRISPLTVGTVDIGAVEVQQAAPLAAIALEKDVDGDDADTAPGPGLLVGDPVTFNYLVSNTGGVDFSVASIGLSDTQSLVPVYQDGDDGDNILEPGETWRYQASDTVKIGQHNELGSVSAQGAVGGLVQASDPGNYFGLAPAISLINETNGQDAPAAPGPQVASGDPVSFSYTVRNSGNEDLINIQLVDDNDSPTDPLDDFKPSFVSDNGGNGDTVLNVGETWTYQAKHTATPGQHTNVAYVIGTPALLGSPVHARDSSNHFGTLASVQTSGLASVHLEKFTNGLAPNSPTDLPLVAGSKVSYTYIVSNTGTEGLSPVSIIDDNGSPTNSSDDLLPTLLSNGNGDAVLDPLENWTYQANGVASVGAYTNVASFVADSLVSAPHVSASGSSHHFGVTASVRLELFIDNVRTISAPGVQLTAGDQVSFRYELTNTGNEALTVRALIDDHGTPANLGDDFSPSIHQLGNGDTILDINETWVYSIERQAAVGAHAHIATVNFTGAGFLGDHSASATSHYVGNAAPTAVPAPKPVPTLNQYGIALLAMLMLAVGVFSQRKAL